MFTIECCADGPIGRAQLADAILDGLGKQPELPAAIRSAEPLAVAWLSLREHTEAIVCDAQLIDTSHLEWLCGTLASAGVRPWLQLASPNGADAPAVAERLDLIADLGGTVAAQSELLDAFPDADRPKRQPRAATRLPRVDGIVFRSACRDLLTPSHFAQVDAEFLGHLARLCAAIEGFDGGNKTRQLARLLRSDLGAAPTTDELVLRARAAQVAGLRCGFQVRVDTTMLLGAAEALPRAGHAVSRDWWSRLDRYRDPDPGAAAALHNAGVHAEHLPELAVGDINETPEGLEVMTPDGPVALTDGARFIRALVVHRQLTSAGEPGAERLFTTHRANRITFRYVAGLLAHPAADVGVQMTTSRVQRRHPDADTWLGRYGITIAKLAYSPTGKTSTTNKEQ